MPFRRLCSVGPPARGCDKLGARSDRGLDRHRPSLVLPFDHRRDARRGTGMSRCRKALSVATSRITADAAEYLRLPPERC